MRWINYPTEADRLARTNGVEVSGQAWSAAPGPGNQWARPAGRPGFVIVTTRARSHDGKPFSVGPHADVLAPADLVP